MNKAHSTIRQLWRDWSKEGFNAEVQPMLGLILEDLDAYLGKTPAESRLLLPGAGLGRLLFELCLAGYNAEGNEISYHQLLTSNFILNVVNEANRYRLYPFLSSFNNHGTRQNQLHCVSIPDIHPGQAFGKNLALGRRNGQMNMTAGDFIMSYSSVDSACSFDSVITVYFIDTASNVIQYMETIHNCLDEGGIWINIGPLLWHFDDGNEKKDADSEQGVIPQDEGNSTAELGSFELTNEEVIVLAQSFGFELLSQAILPPAYGGYIQDSKSMLQYAYRCSHWVMRKMPVATNRIN